MQQLWMLFICYQVNNSLTYTMLYMCYSSILNTHLITLCTLDVIYHHTYYPEYYKIYELLTVSMNSEYIQYYSLWIHILSHCVHSLNVAYMLFINNEYTSYHITNFIVCTLWILYISSSQWIVDIYNVVYVLLIKFIHYSELMREHHR